MFPVCSMPSALCDQKRANFSMDDPRDNLAFVSTENIVLAWLLSGY
jgi:hypothetical protein